MQYYYDINLNFNDYYINYYEWEDKEHFNRLPIYKVESIEVFLDNIIKINTEYKNILVSDGITSLGLEIIDNKVIYVSSVPYEDEFKINKLVIDTDNYLGYEILEKKKFIVQNRIEKVKLKLLALLKTNNIDLIKFIYYEITGEISNDYKKMSKYLTNDIKNNFSNQYYQLYDMIMIGD